ncbi:MAG TPA: dTDP-4-dehydrorhamnose reductase [Patescibacteria group bacterium]|nr:dTDP-4-dehydrorhamnose reductase [Patescibacteria group bacterium]
MPNNMNNKKVLVLGAQGMLGQELVKRFREDAKYSVVGWDREEIDVTDPAFANEKIRTYAPDIIFNAVAYNAVDQCEDNAEEYQKAVLLNANVPHFLAQLVKAMDVTLVHYSTDFVFDGTLEAGYVEDAVPHPLSKYGESKLMGEQYVLATGGKNYIIRLSRLFGKPATSAIAKKSFFEKMLEGAQGKKEVMAVDDEKSCFTYAPDLARASKALLEEESPYGIYHLPNSEAATWYDAAQVLFEIANVAVTVKPVSADTFPRPAKRPRFSVLRNTKRPALRPYTEALREFLQNM